MQKHDNHKCFPKHLSNVSEVCKIFSHRSKIVTKPFLANYTCAVCDPQVSGLSIASHRCTPITHTVGRPGSPRRSLILINRRTQKSEFVDVDPLSHLSSGARWTPWLVIATLRADSAPFSFRSVSQIETTTMGLPVSNDAPTDLKDERKKSFESLGRCDRCVHGHEIALFRTLYTRSFCYLKIRRIRSNKRIFRSKQQPLENIGERRRTNSFMVNHREKIENEMVPLYSETSTNEITCGLNFHRGE